MGKTSLANTFAEFLKSPTEHSKPVLTKGTDLEFTKVMQLYDGLSVNQKKKMVVQVEDLPRNGSVKLVKLKMDQKNVTSRRSSPAFAKKAGKREHFKKIFTSLFTRANDETLALGETSDNESPSRGEKENENDVQLKIVDMGGHSATVVLPTALNSNNQNFVFHKFG